MRTTRTALLVSCLGGLCALLASVDAHAEEPGINPTGKGITGGALLGAEAVMSVEAVAGVKPTWAYLVGGGLGAIGGGIGGYFIEQGDDPKPSYYLLAAGHGAHHPDDRGRASVDLVSSAGRVCRGSHGKERASDRTSAGRACDRAGAPADDPVAGSAARGQPSAGRWPGGGAVAGRLALEGLATGATGAGSAANVQHG